MDGTGLDPGTTLKGRVVEVPPPGLGVTTLTDAEPAVATSEALIWACSWLMDKNVVARALIPVPFNCGKRHEVASGNR